MATKLSEVDWFEWNGVRCTEYGMHVLGQPSIISAAERVSNVKFPFYWAFSVVNSVSTAKAPPPGWEDGAWL